MSYRELYICKSNVFGGFDCTFEEAQYVVLGVPFDATSTYRSGARCGPEAIRQASLNIESYSFRTGIELGDLKLHDLGDLRISTNTRKTLGRLEVVIKDIVDAGKTPVLIGGEHTITLGALKGSMKEGVRPALVSFDAHLDLRDEFLGVKDSHATFMRRISEEVKPPVLIEVGTRAVCMEELNYAKNSGIQFFTAQQVRKEGVEHVVEQLKKALAGCQSVYLSIDMDVLDPAYAPAVQNPEPEGFETHTLLDMLQALCDSRVVGFDVVEVAPEYDAGISSVQAARIVFEVLCCLEKFCGSCG